MVEFVIGILVGAFLFWVLVNHKKPSGTFIVNMTDPLDETFKLELYEGFETLCTKRKIHLDVQVHTDSQN